MLVFFSLHFLDVSSDNMTLTFDPQVKYSHISILQELDGDVVLETRAEVGLLTHNVVMRGSVNKDWTDQIEACEEEFDTGEAILFSIPVSFSKVFHFSQNRI